MTGGNRGAGGGAPDEPSGAAWAPRSSPTPERAMPTSGDSSFHLAGYHDFIEVARGGDSVVYRARQDGLERDVAIKAVSIDDPSTRARFQRELDITVRLGRQHPHIITVLDTGTSASGHACIVMDFFDLGSVHDRVTTQGPLSVDDVITVGSVVADALHFAHGHGVLHRDIKPQNILVLPTSYVLADFGIARMADAGHTASLERFSYRHASPQVLDGEPPTPADDVWSLGSTMFTLLDGRPPFSADDPDDDTALAYLRRVRSGELRSLYRPDAPRELVRIVECCLSARREERFTDAATLAAALSGLRAAGSSWAPGGAGTAVGAGSESTGETPGDGGRGVGDASPTSPPGTHPAPAPTGSTVTWGPVDAVPSLPPPQPAAPGPVAPSALAHLAAPAAGTQALGRVASGPSTFDPDPDVTGLRPAEPSPAEPVTPDDTPTGTRSGRSRWMVTVAFLGGALLLGTLGGALIAVLGSGGDADPGVQASTPPAGGQEIPVDPELTPANDALDPTVNDPDVAPRRVLISDQGTSVRVSWTDPTEGNAIFIVVDVTDETSTPHAVAQVAQEREDVTIEGIDPQQPELCFQVVGILANDPDRAGASERTCLTR
ncbi:serine/threonine-protein kinase [Phytoactinopolyspora limicola]|uniref:serine/threonine-protein kinase n=1 Tax=Phytoactinopolyspora limicola TaxID=2715536 RepID=UPI00140A9CD9|nr:serine/threonine-protein kinase [Phytoactinopolyspora limicola]